MPGNPQIERERDQMSLPLDVPSTSAVWRPIHYLGSKLRLVDAIRTELAKLDSSYGPVCDLFAGSGTVSFALARERKVVASDIQEYSRVLCSALLRPATVSSRDAKFLLDSARRKVKPLEQALAPMLQLERRAIGCAGTEPKLLCDILESGSLLSVREDSKDLLRALDNVSPALESLRESLMATSYFGGIYFSYHQALQIDSLLVAIDELPIMQKDTCKAALLSTASSIVSSVGKQFAQPARPRRRDGTIKRSLISQICRDRDLEVFAVFETWLSRYQQLPKSGEHQIVRGDYRDILANLGNISVVYADPPYTRDHYSRFYHVLETLCLRDFPAVANSWRAGPRSRGLYRVDRHQSPFCIKSQAPAAFTKLFAGARKLGAPLLLSYSPYVAEGHPRLMTVESVAQIAQHYYRSVSIVPAGSVIHSKLNKSEFHRDASKNAEIFIVCKT